MKHLIVFLVSLIGISTAYSEKLLCPSPRDIKLNHFNGWIPLNANSNSQAGPKWVEKFKRKVGDFYLAEYFEDGLFDAHCYYSGFQEVYLAKSILLEPQGSHWHKEGERFRCLSSSVESCAF